LVVLIPRIMRASSQQKVAVRKELSPTLVIEISSKPFNSAE